jgi:hypothetical protein
MPNLRLPRFRFTLRTFLIVCILPVPFLAWLGHIKMTAVRQRAAIAQLESQALVLVLRQRPTPFMPTNLIRTYIDQDAFDTASRVYPSVQGRMFGRRFWKSDDFEALTQLSGLCHLSLLPRDPMATMASRPYRVDLPAETLGKLATIQTLTSLSIDADFDPETQLRLARLPEILSLHLPGTKVTDEMLHELGQSDKISTIDIDASLLTAKGLEGLTHAPVLKTLMLRRLPEKSQLLSPLSKCKALAHLQLHSCSLTAEDAKFINAAPIRSLSLFHCDIKPGFLLGLKGSQTLTKLRIGERRSESLTVEFNGGLDRLESCEETFALPKIYFLPTFK